jgi:pilus assembly protein CpaF
LASYAIQAPERLPLEATNLLIAGAIHFVVYVSVTDEDPLQHGGHSVHSGVPVRRRRYISSIREIVDAEGLQIVSNEVFKPGHDGRAIPGAPLRTPTLADLQAFGFGRLTMQHGPLARV